MRFPKNNNYSGRKIIINNHIVLDQEINLIAMKQNRKFEVLHPSPIKKHFDLKT